MEKFDTIESLASSAIQTLETGNIKQAMILMAHIVGYCERVLEEVTNWEMVREEYEDGIPPRKIAHKHQVAIKEIYNRAYYQGWGSPLKIKKEMRKTRKTYFYPKCRICEHEFEAPNGRAIICPTCKALKRHDENKG
jgi:hypothetical protein